MAGCHNAGARGMCLRGARTATITPPDQCTCHLPLYSSGFTLPRGLCERIDRKSPLGRRGVRWRVCRRATQQAREAKTGTDAWGRTRAAEVVGPLAITNVAFEDTCRMVRRADDAAADLASTRRGQRRHSGRSSELGKPCSLSMA